MTEMKEAALTLIGKMIEIDASYRALNNAARELQGDFSSHHSPIDGCVYPQVVALIDAALGDDEIGSYFLNECRIMKDGGRVTEVDGRTWPLKTLDDLRAYVMREETPPAAANGGIADG